MKSPNLINADIDSLNDFISSLFLKSEAERLEISKRIKRSFIAFLLDNVKLTDTCFEALMNCDNLNLTKISTELSELLLIGIPNLKVEEIPENPEVNSTIIFTIKTHNNRHVLTWSYESK